MNLTRLQKRIIIVGIVLLGFLGLIVPWKFSYGTPAGCSPVFYAPHQNSQYRATSVHVDLIRMFIPMAVVSIATLRGVVLAGSKTAEKPK